MTQGTATTPSTREDRTIILPIGQEKYEKIVTDMKISSPNGRNFGLGSSTNIA